MNSRAVLQKQRVDQNENVRDFMLVYNTCFTRSWQGGEGITQEELPGFELTNLCEVSILSLDYVCSA